MKRSLAAIAFAAYAIASTRAAIAAGGINLQPAISKVCSVMSGAQKPDGQSLQLLMMMDEDLSDPNPVSLGLYRGVLAQCPRAYLAYHQRMRATNPYAKNPLINGSTQLTGGSSTLVKPATPTSYPLRCHTKAGMASASGNILTIAFAKADHPAASGVVPGQCAWDDRAMRPSEPARLQATLDTARRASNGVKQTDAGGNWTYWVYNSGSTFTTTSIAKGWPAKAP